MPPRTVAVIGAGIGGLAAAVELAARGYDVQVFDRGSAPGGKLRTVPVGATHIDAGPTVFTMRWVFDEIFAAAGARLDDHLRLRPAEILGRHVWEGGTGLALYADTARTTEEIGQLAGSEEARRYGDFCARARHIYETLRDPFMRAQRPTLPGLMWNTRLADLLRISPYTSLWDALGEHFRDPRLRQLFGRYSSYCGSSPWESPATLMLIAHVERSGVWLVDGGMHALPRSLAALAASRGAHFHYGAEVREVVSRSGKLVAVRLADGEEVPTATAIVNADVAAVAAGHFGPAAARAVPRQSPRRRSMSAVTWSLVAETAGLPLVRHTVFYAPESRSEFQDALRQRRLPRQPSVYLCAQDRGGSNGPPAQKAERLLCVVNAPANGDQGGPDEAELQAFEVAVFGLLGRCGLHIEREPALSVRHTPVDFEALCPGTGGALYGAVSHGWSAAFRRAGARTALPGLYLAGGSVHPGAGVPMAALSGHLAARRVISDHSRGQGAG